MDRRTQNSAGSDAGDASGSDSPAAGLSASDRELIEGYAGGRTESFTTVDGWVRAELRRTYLSLRHEHDDLSQMIHTKLVANLQSGRFEGRSALRTYVSGIVHHTAIDRLRTLYRDRALSVAAIHESKTPSGNPYRTLEALDERKQLVQVLHTLPETCRTLWHMVFVEKLSYEAIAERLAVPGGTVKSRMWHCRRKALAALERVRRLAGQVRDTGLQRS